MPWDGFCTDLKGAMPLLCGSEVQPCFRSEHVGLEHSGKHSFPTKLTNGGRSEIELGKISLHAFRLRFCVKCIRVSNWEEKLKNDELAKG
jgi:hypothetical protein